MTAKDRARWDERYRTGDWADVDEPAIILRRAEAWLSPSGLALDVACGAGRNSLWLAEHGFKVIAVDISWEGLQRLLARSRGGRLDIHPIQFDLEQLHLPCDVFDVIINTRFLLRSLFPLYRTALKAGGLLLFETYTVDEIEVLGGDIRREYALERGELHRAFADLDLLHYEEGIFDEPEGERGLARLVARKRRR